MNKILNRCKELLPEGKFYISDKKLKGIDASILVGSIRLNDGKHYTLRTYVNDEHYEIGVQVLIEYLRKKYES